MKYEEFIASVDHYPEASRPLCYALGLAGEAGEVCDKLKKIIRDKDGKFEVRDSTIAAELGDVIWYVARMASFFGYALDEIIEGNQNKLEDRAKRGVIKGSGDNR